MAASLTSQIKKQARICAGEHYDCRATARAIRKLIKQNGFFSNPVNGKVIGGRDLVDLGEDDFE